MNVNDIGRAAARANGAPDRDALRHVARELESVFVARLMQAMREAMPADEASGGQAMETFGFLMDQRLSAVAANRNGHGLADAVYRELARRAGIDPGSATAAATHAHGVPFADPAPVRHPDATQTHPETRADGTPESSR